MLTIADTDTKDERAKKLRRDRVRCHSWLREFSSRVGATQCMTSNVAGLDVEVSVTADGRAHVSGVRRCGSINACPLCAPVIREKRAGQIDTVLGRALAAGYHLEFVTATIQHSLGWALVDTLEALQKSWTAGFGGRAARWDLPDSDRQGYVGMVRALDFTHSSVNGWHPHIHAVLVFDPSTTADERASWLQARRTSYRKALQKRGYFSAASSVGWHTVSVDSTGGLATYAAKVDGGWGAGLELARTDIKASRHISGATPFELLRSAALDGDLDAAALFCEYESATNGRRALLVGRRLKELFGAGVELDADDVDLATVVTDTVPVYVKSIRPALWNHELGRGRLALLLESVVEEARRYGLIPETTKPPDTT